MGWLQLGLESDLDVRRIARASESIPEHRVVVDEFVKEVSATRVREWAYSEEYPSNGRAAVATLLPAVEGHPARRWLSG